MSPLSSELLQNVITYMYLNHEIDFVATRKVGEIPSRFEMGSLGIGVAFVHFLLASLG